MRFPSLCSFVAALIIAASTTSAQNVKYNVIPINSPFNPPGLVIGQDINDHGVIPLTDLQNGQEQAFVWKSGASIPLKLLGGSCSIAVGINDAGHIVGGACPPGESLAHAFLYLNGETRDLGTFGGIAAAGIRVNRLNQVAGDYTPNDGTSRVFFWHGNKWTDVGSLGGSFIYALGLNSSGIVTGQSDISNNPDLVFGIPQFHGFIWVAGVRSDFGSIFGSNFNYGNAINDAGVVTGSADLPGDTGAHAFLWNQGIVQDLTPDGDITAWGIDINNHGQVVGSLGSVDTNPADGPPVNVMVCPCFAVLWQSGQTTFLNDVVPPAWNMWLGLAINDRGEILARGQFNGGRLRTVLLEPITPDTPRSSGLPQAISEVQRALSYPASAPRAVRRDESGGFREIR